MKRTLFYLAAAACLLVGCNRMQKFTVNGDLASAGLPAETKTLQLVSDGLPQPLVATVTDGTFSFQGEVKEPVLAKLITDDPDQKRFPSLILQKGAITFEANRPIGTPLNDANKAFVEQLTAIRKENAGNREALIKATDEAYLDFVSEHKKDPCAVFAILLAEKRIAPETILKLISTASPAVQNVGEVRSLKLRTEKKTEK